MAKMRKPIPSDAKCVFKGKIFEVWQWEQKMFDGSTVTFERLRRPDTVQVIATESDSILLVKERQPDTDTYFSLPGGRADEGEDPLEACKRELLEETGYTSNSWELFYEDDPVGKMDWTIHTYIARDCTKVQEPALDGGEEITLEPVSLDRLLNLTDDESLHVGTVKELLLRARFNPEDRDELKNRLFGKLGVN
jgi:ADP-ribose pyrophosphatase